MVDNTVEESVKVYEFSIQDFILTILIVVVFYSFFELKLVYNSLKEHILPEIISFFSVSENKIEYVDYKLADPSIHVSLLPLFDHGRDNNLFILHDLQFDLGLLNLDLLHLIVQLGLLISLSLQELLLEMDLLLLFLLFIDQLVVLYLVFKYQF